MSGNVAHLPTRAAIDRAWERYVGLVQTSRTDERLRTDLSHQQSIATAWEEWRDLFLAGAR